MAYAVVKVIPVPLGLGTFEGGLVASLHGVGLALAPALTTSLLLRGFTLWLRCCRDCGARGASCQTAKRATTVSGVAARANSSLISVAKRSSAAQSVYS
jgi:hypothetical protein